MYIPDQPCVLPELFDLIQDNVQALSQVYVAICLIVSVTSVLWSLLIPPGNDFVTVLASSPKHERMDKGLFKNFIEKQSKPVS